MTDLLINQKNISTIIDKYNSESNLELELVYNSNVDEKTLKKLLKYLRTVQTTKEGEVYILDIFLSGIKNNRLSIKSDTGNIINEHCTMEYNLQQKEMENIYEFPDNYILENKETLLKEFIEDLNTKINVKEEYNIVDELKKTEFIQLYNKLKKTYRFKKRISFEFEENYRVDISIVKQTEGHNILLSNIDTILEKIEVEIEFMEPSGENNLTEEIIINMISLMTKFNQYNNEGYFNISKKENILINRKYKDLILTSLNKNKYNGIGPKPLALTKKTIINMLDVLDSNNLNYMITEKADGERYFMYIDEESILYLLNENNNVLKTGIKLNSSDFNNSILDGELLYYPENTKNVYEYKYFDIYILNKKETYTEDLNTRINKMIELENKILTESTKYLSDDIFIKCIRKEYSDLTNFSKIYEKKYDYGIDGVILMPGSDLNNIDNKSYNTILKYKPLDENSIDVLVINEELYCGYKIKRDYIKCHIMCLKPYIVDLYKKRVKKDGVEMDYNLINNKVIEVVFEPENDCFRFLKIRHDKTETYLRENKITANNFHIINDIIEYTFNSIPLEDMNNLTKEYITNIKNTTNKSGYYVTDNVSRIEDREKKLRKKQNEIKTLIINNVISILENDDDLKNDIKVLDLASGRGGDLLKYLNTNFKENNSRNEIKKEGGVKFILGIDQSSVNIEYTDKFDNNNARGRFISYKNNLINNNKKLPDIYNENNVYFITGDLNLYNNETTINDSYNSIMDNIKYINPKTKDNLDNNNDFEDRTKLDKKILYDIKNIKKIEIYDENLFEFISCQFAIHYFDLEKFCKYVDLQLKESGIFACTFMEKNFVNELFEKNENDIVSGKFWSLKKSTTNPESKILVKFGTLEGEDYKEENLITLEQLSNTFQKYNITLYENPLSESISNMSAVNSVIDFKDYINDTDPELEFNKLYRGVIFQKNLSNKSTATKLGSIVN